jgi:hypothetical protein
MNIASKLDQKTLLAKLFASENIQIRHRAQIQTAAFDVKKRILYLPVWKDVTNELYNLLISHEVGHALYTPKEEFEKILEKGPAYKSLVNIVEDARIEKMIQNKFPGLRKDYYKGYADLLDRGLFNLKDKDVRKDIGEYEFFDRVNIHFKGKDHIDVPFFDEKEKEIVRRVDACVTFEDVLKLCDELYDDLEEQEIETSSDFEMIDGEGEGEGDGEGGCPKNSFSGTLQCDPGDEKTEKSGDTPFVSMSKFDIENISKKLIDTRVGEVVYFNMPSDKILQNYIIDNKKLVSEIIASNDDRRGKNLSSKIDKKIINYMYKLFEQKKAASEYKKISISKTGKLDTNKLHHYKIKEDLFRKNSVVQDARNHGVIMLVDFSGSMSTVIENVLYQVFELMEFCKKSKIKYKIFSFTNGYGTPDCETNEGDLILDRTLQMVELFNSEMKRTDFETIMTALGRFISGNGSCPYITMGGTPLSSSIFVMDYVIRDFQKKFDTEILNLIVLSDGDPTDYFRVVENSSKVDINRGKDAGKMFMVYNQNRVVEFNPMNKKTTVTVKDMYYNMLKFIKERYCVNTIHFDLTQNTNYSLESWKDNFGEHTGIKKDDPCFSIESNQMKKYYNSYYIVHSPSIFGKQIKEKNIKKQSLEELEEYMTDSNSVFRYKSAIMRNFCENISKKLLT